MKQKWTLSARWLWALLLNVIAFCCNLFIQNSQAMQDTSCSLEPISSFIFKNPLMRVVDIDLFSVIIDNDRPKGLDFTAQ